MEALIASYGECSSDSDSSPRLSKNPALHCSKQDTEIFALPPPPLSLLTPQNHIDIAETLETPNLNRVRTFPHVEGNYALYVYIPVSIPQPSKTPLVAFLKKISDSGTALQAIEIDTPLFSLCKDDERLSEEALGREFHISLGRTVPIRIHQIDSVVSMLRQRLQHSKRFWADFSKWEVFVNDDRTRTFLSIELIGRGLLEIVKRISMVNEVYKLHNLPEFYKDPRPHISLAWIAGDRGEMLRRAVKDEEKLLALQSKGLFECVIGAIECKIGSRTYSVSKGN